MTHGDVSIAAEEMEADRMAGLDATAIGRVETVAELMNVYAPGTFGCHEALHTAAIVVDLVDERLCDHPAILANADCYRLAREAHAKLFDLYQTIGKLHLDQS